MRCRKTKYSIINKTFFSYFLRKFFFISISNYYQIFYYLENLSIHKIKTITSKVKFGKVLNQGTILFDGAEFNNILKYNKVSFVSLTINSLSLSGTSPFYIPSKRLKYISNDVSREKNESLVLVTFEDSDDNICVYGSFDATKVTAMAINFYTIN